MEHDSISILKNVNVLYAEDDTALRLRTGKMLRSYFREVILVENGEQALSLFHTHLIHIVITDLKMPRMDGLELAKEIRRLNSHIPIFIISGHAEIQDLLRAIRLNCIDYLIKPACFSRIRETLDACARKIEESGDVLVQIRDNAIFKPLSGELFVDNMILPLTRKERVLLELLTSQRGRTVRKDLIEEQVYERDEMSEAALKNLVLRLRKKIGKDTITSVHSTGYMLK
ncbi:response regulator [Desulfurispira natronophila]|uniref:DNA-binding response OmpR family regulator n=1 Tax=Desulfurispira natronophila TaxID=682562 RepID=A0A7W7Y4X5_9BACT|nr:DNA-binding response OmpR family regulator [Desulfurispira natronophila]